MNTQWNGKPVRGLNAQTVRVWTFAGGKNKRLHFFRSKRLNDAVIIGPTKNVRRTWAKKVNHARIYVCRTDDLTTGLSSAVAENRLL